MYEEAFGRLPVDAEIAEIERFLGRQVDARGADTPDDPGVWADFAHAMFNMAEFLFVR